MEEKFPWGYAHPTEKGLKWVCSRDEDNNIISVFIYRHQNGSMEKQPQNLSSDVAKATYIRDELIKDGWYKIVKPKIEFVEEGKK